MFRCVSRWLAAALALIVFAAPLAVHAEAPTVPGSVQVMFLPPPLDAAVYSVGLYETKTGRLVRRLHEDAGEDDFTAALNGFITSWDRKDDAGRTVPAGRYAARGWAVGETRVEGVDILGNEWTEEDETLRVTGVQAICLIPADDGLAVRVATAGESTELLRVSGKDGRVLWRAKVSLDPTPPPPSATPTEDPSIFEPPSPEVLAKSEFQDRGGGSLQVQGDHLLFYDGDPSHGRWRVFALQDGRELPPSAAHPGPEGPDDKADTFERSTGRPGTFWMILGSNLALLPDDALREDHIQPDPSGDAAVRLLRLSLRHLPIDPKEPGLSWVSASKRTDRVYLLEHRSGWQRVRGLEWSATRRDAAGRPVSEWRTFFERNIRRPDPALGLDETGPSPAIELPLAKNPLEPNKPQSVKLHAGFDATGSYLETADGLRLLPVSVRPNLRAARLTRDPKSPDRLLFSQFDGAAWDVFSLTGLANALVSFDTGEFELTADGERRPSPPVGEPRDP